MAIIKLLIDYIDNQSIKQYELYCKVGISKHKVKNYFQSYYLKGFKPNIYYDLFNTINSSSKWIEVNESNPYQIIPSIANKTIRVFYIKLLR